MAPPVVYGGIGVGIILFIVIVIIFVIGMTKSSPSPSPNPEDDCSGLLKSYACSLSSKLISINSDYNPDEDVKKTVRNLVKTTNSVSGGGTATTGVAGFTVENTFGRIKSNFEPGINLLDSYEFANINKNIKLLYSSPVLSLIKAFFKKLLNINVPPNDLQRYYYASLRLINQINSSNNETDNVPVNIFMDKFLDFNGLFSEVIQGTGDFSTKDLPEFSLSLMKLDEFSTVDQTVKDAYHRNICRIFYTVEKFIIMSSPASQSELYSLSEACLDIINTELLTAQKIGLEPLLQSPSSTYYPSTSPFSNTLIDLEEFRDVNPEFKTMYKTCIVPIIRALCSKIKPLSADTIRKLNGVDTKELEAVFTVLDLSPLVKNITKV